MSLLEEKTFYRDFFKQRLPDVKVLELEGAEEAMFEATAVNYAAEKSGLGKPNLQLAAGGGSINMVFENAPFNIETGFRAGQGKLLANGLAAVEECETMATEYIDTFLAEAPLFQTPKVSCLLFCQSRTGMVFGVSLVDSQRFYSNVLFTLKGLFSMYLFHFRKERLLPFRRASTCPPPPLSPSPPPPPPLSAYSCHVC